MNCLTHTVTRRDWYRMQDALCNLIALEAQLMGDLEYAMQQQQENPASDDANRLVNLASNRVRCAQTAAQNLETLLLLTRPQDARPQETPAPRPQDGPAKN